MVEQDPVPLLGLHARALLPCACRTKDSIRVRASLFPCEVGAQSPIYRPESEAWGESGQGALPSPGPLVPALSSPAPSWSPDEVLQAQGPDDVLSLPSLVS